MLKIVRPTLIVDKTIALNNIEKMTAKAARNGLKFRPHFKTHQSAEIGEWFRKSGVSAITVSSVQMARYFAGYGWNDITLAFPVNILEMGEINQLAATIRFNVVIENTAAASALVQHIKNPLGVYIKIDTGYYRTGISSSKTSAIIALIKTLEENKNLVFKGFLAHTGHTYHAKSLNEIYSLHFDALLKLKKLKNKFVKEFPGIEISLGDTPSASVCANFDGIDEIRPGNFVFYDLMQYQLGVCGIDNIAVKLVCPVVAKHSSRNEIVIYGGAVHLSKEGIQNSNGKPMYGRILVLNDGRKMLLDQKNYVTRLSQEHGILRVAQQNFKHFEIGDLVEILPVHSCLTANLMGFYQTTDGEVLKMMPKY